MSVVPRVLAASALLFLLLASDVLAQTPPAPEAALVAAPAGDAPAEAKPAKRSKARSDVDGKLDISGFLDQVYGFVPIVSPSPSRRLVTVSGAGCCSSTSPRERRRPASGGQT